MELSSDNKSNLAFYNGLTRVNFAEPEIALNRKFYKKMASWIGGKEEKGLCVTRIRGQLKLQFYRTRVGKSFEIKSKTGQN